jgi:hypothetical protein
MRAKPALVRHQKEDLVVDSLHAPGERIRQTAREVDQALRTCKCGCGAGHLDSRCDARRATLTLKDLLVPVRKSRLRPGLLVDRELSDLLEQFLGVEDMPVVH